MKFKASLNKKDTKGKYIFWDIDGTLAPYRFNGHLSDPNGSDNGMSFSEIEDGIFLKRPPSKFMQKVVNTCGAKQNIVMGHVLCEKEIADKNIWLDKYFPQITDRIFRFVETPKHESIIAYCNEHKINLEDVIFVDDVLKILREAERNGIPAYHISSFLDYEYEN